MTDTQTRPVDTRTDWEQSLRGFLDTRDSDTPTPPVATDAIVRRIRPRRTSGMKKPRDH